MSCYERPTKRTKIADADIHKRKPELAASAVKTIYISRKTPFVSALKRIQKAKLPVQLVGMGAAIEKTLSLALYMRDREKTIRIETGTVECHDDVLPHDPNAKIDEQVRLSSKITVAISEP